MVRNMPRNVEQGDPHKKSRKVNKANVNQKDVKKRTISPD